MIKKFLTQHSSVTFLGLLLILAICALWGGVNLASTKNAAYSVLSLFLIQLSGIFFVAVITTLFFSFPDVRRHLGQTLGALLSEGQMVASLSNSARERLWRSLLAARLEAKSVSIQDSLERRLRALLDSSLVEFHRYNVIVRMTLSRCQATPGYLIMETVTTFRVRADHIRGNSKLFKYQYLDEVAVHPGASKDEMSKVLDFRVRLGTEVFSREHLSMAQCFVGGVEGMRFTFEKEVYIDGEIDVEIVAKTHVDARDLIHTVIARYPTYGLSLTLTFDDSHSYECVWFSADDLDGDMVPGLQKVAVHSNGLTAYTQGWVLPGDGVVISRTPKEKA